MGNEPQCLGSVLKEGLEEANKAIDTMKETMKKAKDTTDEKLAVVDGER